MPAKPAAAATAARRALADQFSGRANRAFYVAVLAVALTGSAIAAEDWLDWWFIAALGAVALAELGGVALSVFADRRRQLGERAVFARLLSAAVAAGAVAINFFGHGHNLGAACFFSGFSLLGYLVWLLDSAARRRDALREAGKLPETPPVYGPWQWTAHPLITRRARALCLVNAEQRLVERIAAAEAGATDPQPTTPLLGRLASLQAAAADVRRERRQAAIESALRDRIAASTDRTVAKIAVNTYDLTKVADVLSLRADYPGLADLIGRDLVPARIATVPARRRWWARGTGPAAVEIGPGTDPALVGTDPIGALVDQLDAAPDPRPQVVPDDARLLPVRCAESLPGPIPAPALTGPVVPAGARLLPVVSATAPAPAEVPAPPAETDPGPVPAPPAETPVPVVAQLPAPAADETGPTDPETSDGLPGVPVIPEKLREIVENVMRSRRDWHLAVTLPPKHPDALSASKIKKVGETGSQQYALDTKALLVELAKDRVGALHLVDPDGTKGINRNRSTAGAR